MYMYIYIHTHTHTYTYYHTLNDWLCNVRQDYVDIALNAGKLVGWSAFVPVYQPVMIYT